MDSSGPLAGILAALGLSVINTLIGYVVAKKAFGKPLNTFLSIIFGSLGIRSLAVIASAWYCLSVVHLHQLGFALTFAIALFVMILGEIFFFHRSYEKTKRSVRRPVTELLKKKWVGEPAFLLI